MPERTGHMIRALGLTIALVLAASLSGCAYLNQQAEAQPAQAAAQTAEGQSQAQTQAPKATASATVFYDFDDVPVPAAFKLDRKDSFVYESGDLRTGVLAFDGYVDTISAANAMIGHMVGSNWKLKSQFKYGRTMLMFEKPGKLAVITLTEGLTNSRMEVWVAPGPTGD